jgi:hypothetical protein
MDTATSTAIQLAQSRDALDLIVAVSQSRQGTVLGGAASMAFVIQRARYFREVEPDLRVVGANVEAQQREDEVKFVPPILKVSYDIRNESSNPGIIESKYVQLEVFETGGSWSNMGVDGETDLDQSVVLPDDTVMNSVHLLARAEQYAGTDQLHTALCH